LSSAANALSEIGFDGLLGMTDSSRELLRRIFLVGYDDLKLRLTRRLGSTELAGDALHEAWLRLEHTALIGPIRRPRPYIFRIAYNIALKRLRGERDMISLEEVRGALNLIDEAPTPAQAMEARTEMILLLQAAEELTPRRRDILFAARLDGDSVKDIAQRYGISERAVARELKSAVLFCAARVDRKAFQRHGPRPDDSLTEESEMSVQEIEE
jgi:RNA polymerase sigma-70 factor, ECF subfamily